MDKRITVAKRFSKFNPNRTKSILQRIGQLVLETIISLMPLFLMLLFLFLVDTGSKEGAWLVLDGDLVWCALTSLIMIFFEVFLNSQQEKKLAIAGIVFNVLYAMSITAVYVVIKFVNNFNTVAETLKLKEHNAYALIISIFLLTFIINVANIIIFWRKD